MMNEVQVFDNFLNEESQQSIIDYCRECQYRYGETDNGDDVFVPYFAGGLEAGDNSYKNLRSDIIKKSHTA